MKSTDTAETIVNTLDIFYRAVQIPLSLVNPDFETVFCLPSYEYTFWPPELVKAQAEIMQSKNLPPDCPYLLSDHFDIHTGMFRLQDGYFLILGPVSSGALNLEEVARTYSAGLSPERERAFLNAYRTSIPTDIIRFANILAMTAHLMFGSHPDPIGIIRANYPQQAAVPPARKEQITAEDLQTSPDEIIQFENMLVDAVRAGNSAYLAQALRTMHPLFQQAPVHNAQREPYTTLPLLTLMRFAALHGGAGKEKVYAIYDRAAAELAQLKSSSEHIALVARTAEALCALVAESRFGQAHSEARRKIERYVAHHLSEHITLHDLAEACSLSERQVSRIFEECFRMKMTDYIHKERVSRAATLLTASNFTIGEIAYRLGYASQSHFSSTFKKYTGLTPGEYQKNPGKIP